MVLYHCYIGDKYRLYIFIFATRWFKGACCIQADTVGASLCWRGLLSVNLLRGQLLGLLSWDLLSVSIDVLSRLTCAGVLEEVLHCCWMVAVGSIEVMIVSHSWYYIRCLLGVGGSCRFGGTACMDSTKALYSVICLLIVLHDFT